MSRSIGKISAEDIIETLPLGIITTDNNDIITTANKRAGDIAGVKAEQLIGNAISVLDIQGIFKAIAETNTAIVHARNGRKLLVAKNYFNSAGLGSGCIYSLYDIAGSDESEIEFSHLHRRLESLIEGSHDGIILIDQEKIVRVNNSYLRISGLKKEKIEGTKISTLDNSPHI